MGYLAKISQKQAVAASPENHHIMPLALFECLQGLAQHLVLDADLQHPQILFKINGLHQLVPPGYPSRIRETLQN